MEVVNGSTRVHSRLCGAPAVDKVCYHWRAGRCNRNPCQYLHSELPQATGSRMAPNRTHLLPAHGNFSGSVPSRKRISAYPGTDMQLSKKWVRGQNGKVGGGSMASHTTQEKPNSACPRTDMQSSRKWVRGQNGKVGGGSTASHTTQEKSNSACPRTEGPWVFVGMPNVVKAWNTQSNAHFSLSSSSGQVYALVVDNDGMLLAGTQDGSILAWKISPATNNFELVASLKGHTSSVVSLIFGANRLYSGSMDCTIRVWDLETFQCLHTLTEHTSVVTSLLCWDQFLLSCSLDQTIKVWAATESGVIEVIYTHPQEHGLLTLCGIHDAEEKPVLICSRNNDSVVLYDLPSFKERGKIFARKEIRAIQIGPGGIFFTGDGAGELKVWKLS